MKGRPNSSTDRLGYIDQFRGLATIFMIETHVVNALLLTSLEAGIAFAYLNFVNGLVAPAFLFVSGFSFTLALNRKGEAYRRFSPQLLKHLKRLLYIWLTGYFLHVPFLSLRKTLYGTLSSGGLDFTVVDILQCIAVTLFILHVLRVIVKKDGQFRALIWFLFVFFIAAAPLAGSIDFARYLPLFLAQYFNRMHGALFPLFPWSGFLIGGTIASQYVTKHTGAAAGGTARNRAPVRILVLGAVAAAAGFFLIPLEKHFLVDPHFPHYSPTWFLLRLGLLLIILYGITVYEGRRDPGSSIIKLFGRETFFVYVLHLVIVYGSSLSFPSLVNLIGPNLSYAECLGVFLVLSAAMYFAAWGWHWLKSSNFIASRRIQYLFVTIVLYLFIRNPY